MRLLALSWAMPPLLFPRALQVSRLLKGLSRLGVETDVVTALPSSVPGAVLDHDLAGRYEGFYRSVRVDCSAPAGWRTRLLRWLPSVPRDPEAAWRQNGLEAAERLLADGSHDALATFAQPWSDHGIGLAIKRRRPELFWLAHFSDPWTDSPYYAHLDGATLRSWRAQEAEVIGHADAVVFVNRQTADLVMAKYPADWSRRVHVLPHGCDPDLAAGLPEPPAPGGRPLSIVHTGSLYGRRVPTALFRALGELRGRLPAGNLPRFRFVGPGGEDVRNAVADARLEDIVRLDPPRPFLDCLRLTAEADLLLLLDAPAEENVFLPSKLFDYMIVRRPILGLTPSRGATAEVLRECGCPQAPPDAPGAIADVLAGLAERWRSGEPIGSPGSRECWRRYDIDHVAGLFLNILSPCTRQA